MSKRKDNKKRVLRRGEGQRPDGRYYFKYKNAKGETRYIYSWKLEPHDVPPADKKNEESLREMGKR